MRAARHWHDAKATWHQQHYCTPPTAGPAAHAAASLRLFLAIEAHGFAEVYGAEQRGDGVVACGTRARRRLVHALHQGWECMASWHGPASQEVDWCGALTTDGVGKLATSACTPSSSEFHTWKTTHGNQAPQAQAAARSGTLTLVSNSSTFTPLGRGAGGASGTCGPSCCCRSGCTAAGGGRRRRCRCCPPGGRRAGAAATRLKAAAGAAACCIAAARACGGSGGGYWSWAAAPRQPRSP